MDTKVVVALVGAAGTVSATLASSLLKGRKETTQPKAAVSPPNAISVAGNTTDNVIGSTDVIIDRSQHNITVAAPERRPASISIVDISTSSYSRVGCSVIELKLRNPSDEVVFLKRADIEIVGQWNIPREGNPYAVPISWTYDADVSSGRAGIALSQAIEPNQVDRFEITVGCKTVEGRYPFRGLFLYLIRLTILYNESNLMLECPKMLVHIPCPMEIAGYSTHGMKRDFVAKNKALAQEAMVAMGKNAVVETELLQALRSWAEADLSEFEASA